MCSHWMSWYTNAVRNQYIKAYPILILCLSCSQVAIANSQWRTCNTPYSNSSLKYTPLRTGALLVEADQGTIAANGISTLEGRVIIQQDKNLIHADKATYDNRNSDVTAFGNVLFVTDSMKLKSSEIHYQMNSGKGELKNAEYSLSNGLGHGSSKLLKQTGKEYTQLKDATFSTCPPNQRSWHIASSDIKLDHKNQEGVARNVTFKVGSIPVFYSPYFSFPLNSQRKSGFLAPSFKVSDRSGTVLSTPYYLNLAPNFDATLTPNFLTNRGIKLDTQFRYLTPNDAGIIGLEYLPGDNVFNNEDRSLASIHHKTRLSKHTQLSINATDISDKDYFQDFGDSLVNSSIAALERRIDLTHLGKNWTFNTSIQDYKILDNSNTQNINDNPYSRLPELRFHYAPSNKIGETRYGFETELVNFEKENATTGLRFDLNTTASRRFGDSSWYVEPSIQLRHTQYALDNLNPNNDPNNKLIENSLSRTLPTASIDTGLFFERNIKNGQLIQTLEPRLLYTYTPYKDQSNIPVFDSAANSFSTSTQLFAKNRFTGKDRIGDTNQLTAALTTRLINQKNGHEVLTASIGQIFFLNDQKVTLPNTPIENSGSSQLAMEFSGELNNRMRIITGVYWDPQKEIFSSTDTRLHYQDKKNRRLNLAYRTLDEELEQAEISFSTPLNNNWSLVGKFEQDLKNDRSLEALGGVEYTNCCWKTRIVTRRFLTSDNVTYDNVPFIEFELKGLGSLGTGATNLLEEQIYGYEN